MNTSLFIRLLLLTFSLIPVADAQIRTWENAEGVQIEAELILVEGEHVLLRKDASVYRVPIPTLSQADRDFLEVRNAERQPTRTPQTAVDPGSTPQDRVGKKGIGISAGKYPDWRKRIRALNPGWFYNWTHREPENVPDGVEFVPMVFGREGRVRPAVEYLKRVKEERGYRYVLGHNEPDASRQSNRSIHEVLEDWPLLMEIGLPLISPGAIHPDREWMISFMKGVDERGLRVDFIAVHFYGGPNHKAFLNRLERIHRMYRRPIWITEFAVGDWQAENAEENRHSPKDILTFMRRVLPELEKRSYIYRYAWYSADPDNPALGTSALFNQDGTPTALGIFYGQNH